MANLTNLVDADISAISNLYGLEITHYQPIIGGDENSSFLLNGGSQDYVLTFYEIRSLSGVERQVLLLKHLAMHGYHTNRVLPEIHGNGISSYQGKPMILKTWIPGETLRDTDQDDYQSIGRSIAQLHEIPAPEFLPSDHPYGLKRMPDSLDHKVDLEYEAWLVDKIAYLQNSFPADLPQALIHGDLFDDNIIYHQRQFQAIIDFGDACYYTRAYDLGSVLFGACMQDGELNLKQSGEVLRGYQEIIPLNPEERNTVQFFAVYAGAAISAWHYLNTFIRQPADSRLDKYKLAAQRTEEIFGLPDTEFNTIFGTG